MSTKGLLLVIAVWFLMLWETSCQPVYTPVKVMVTVPPSVVGHVGSVEGVRAVVPTVVTL